MCGVFGVVLPGGEPTDAASVAALGLFTWRQLVSKETNSPSW